MNVLKYVDMYIHKSFLNLQVPRGLRPAIDKVAKQEKMTGKASRVGPLSCLSGHSPPKYLVL